MTQLRPIYFDYAATTPVDEDVAVEMAKYLAFDGVFGNPSSKLHGLGQAAEDAVDLARDSIAWQLGCLPSELVFTSGATESNNLALKGVAGEAGRPIHIITTAVEHKSILATCEALEVQGCEVSYLAPQESGLLDLDELATAIQPNTVLLSILHVNNETGVKQDLAAISAVIAGKDILFHVDAAQSCGKVPINLQQLSVDLLSVSAHKFYGPKGIGALFVRRSIRDRLRPIIDGGGQEHGLRSGTLPTHQIVGMGMAAQIAKENLGECQARIEGLATSLVDRIASKTDVLINGDRSVSIPNIVNLSFPGVDADALLVALRNEFALSSSSACTTGTIEPSHVLRAMGFEGDRLYGGIRISVGRYTTADDVKLLATRLIEEVERIRALEAQST